MTPMLQIDGRPVKSRFLIRLRGCDLPLRAKSFKYLFRLAAARFLSADGWITKSEIEPGDNQIKYLYQLRQELSAGDGSQSANSALIENDGSGRYRLALGPRQIEFDFERLAAFPDWEIQQNAGQLLAVQRGQAAA